MEKFLLIGLGNPGTKYENTRHNIGQIFVWWLKSNLSNNDFTYDKQCLSKIIKINLIITKRKKERDIEIILALPQSFMNESGKPIKKLLAYYYLKPEQVFIVHDDNDLKLGEFKITFNQKSAGHKGVNSIINTLNTQKFHRIKIGIQPQEASKRIKAEKIVLQKFTPLEEVTLKKLFPQIKIAWENYLRQIIK
ncbi:MAG: aminoacyl-tRNA hydrolase [Minisyncoccia bacterium]